MYALVERLYPLCRSITGDGVRATLDIVDEYIPLHMHEVPTGTQVLDWTVPQEWNIRDAYVADATGRRVVDFAASSLHVLGYSVPVSATMPLAELRPHLHTLPDHPAWVPYRTSYYRPQWGFCLAQETLDALPEGDYEVRIDSTLADGHLTYAEHVVQGQVSDEVIVSCHVCHPSLANDNLASTSRWPRSWPGSWRSGIRTTPTGSSSRPAPSGRSPGWPATGSGWNGSSTAWCWPARATPGR